MVTVQDIPKKEINDSENTLWNWGFFSEEELNDEPEMLRMLDIDFGRLCSLRCPSCYRRDNDVDDYSEDDLSYDELMGVIDDAIPLGLRSVKICGAGEPTEDPRFVKLAYDLTRRFVGLCSFTAGQVLGSDSLAKEVNSGYGISSARELCDMLSNFDVSFVLKYQSFDASVQDRMVGKQGHSTVRDQALVNLVNAGFNKTPPTRLGIITGPITKVNYEGQLDLYAFARERNIYPISNVLMTCGNQIDDNFLSKIDITDKQKIDLWTQIYSWNIENGVQSLDEIRDEEISCLAGAHPCNQLRAGLYLTANGNVVACPGYSNVIGNVREESISEIWEKSLDRVSCAGKFNCHCPPKDGITIPDGFYDRVLENLEVMYG